MSDDKNKMKDINNECTLQKLVKQINYHEMLSKHKLYFDLKTIKSVNFVFVIPNYSLFCYY